MPIYKTINKDFFKKWTPDMAYILGFFAADGSMTKNKRGAHFIEFQITDKDLLYAIREVLGSNHKITVRKRKSNYKTSYRLQIGSKEIFSDLIKIGITPNKSKIIALPKIPKVYFHHFVRGYFDGDGSVNICTYNKQNLPRSSTIINSGFTSGSKTILQTLKHKLTNLGIIKGGTLYYSRGYRLWFSINDSLGLYRFMYKNLKPNNVFLQRKKMIFEKYLKTCNLMSHGNVAVV